MHPDHPQFLEAAKVLTKLMSEPLFGGQKELLEQVFASLRAINSDYSNRAEAARGNSYANTVGRIAELNREKTELTKQLQNLQLSHGQVSRELERATRAVPGLAATGTYTEADVEAIERFRGKSYARLRLTVRMLEKWKAEALGARRRDEERAAQARADEEARTRDAGFPGHGAG